MYIMTCMKSMIMESNANQNKPKLESGRLAQAQAGLRSILTTRTSLVYLQKNENKKIT